MGQSLSQPVVTKESSALEDNVFKVGSSCMQGWRDEMEDAHIHVLNTSEDRDAALFGVFDGHGGHIVSSYVSKYLQRYVLQRPEYKEGKITHALQMGFLDCDTAIRNDLGKSAESCGSTAIIVLIKDNQTYTCNVGDSRAVVGTNGNVEALSIDHKPYDELEKERILNAGGHIEDSRVNGILALSRAMGDFQFKHNSGLQAKDQMVSAFPDVLVKEVADEWDFLILACDGIWDVMTNEDVVNFVTKMIGLGHEPEIICEKLMEDCLAEVYSGYSVGCDNMSVILICFLHDLPYSSLVKKCSKINLYKSLEISSTLKGCAVSEMRNYRTSLKVSPTRMRKEEIRQSKSCDLETNDHPDDGGGAIGLQKRGNSEPNT